MQSNKTYLCIRKVAFEVIGAHIKGLGLLPLVACFRVQTIPECVTVASLVRQTVAISRCPVQHMLPCVPMLSTFSALQWGLPVLFLNNLQYVKKWFVTGTRAGALVLGLSSFLPGQKLLHDCRADR